VLHPGTSLCKAANELSLKCLGQGGRVAWVEVGHMTLLHIIPHRAGLSSNLRYTGFLCMAHTNITVHLTGWMGLAVQWLLCPEQE
jgi:hypothetical protein